MDIFVEQLNFHMFVEVNFVPFNDAFHLFMTSADIICKINFPSIDHTILGVRTHPMLHSEVGISEEDAHPTPSTAHILTTLPQELKW